jgi:precorrin-6B methylase 2
MASRITWILKHTIRYCKILSVVIMEAKKLNSAAKIKKSMNKNKTVWDIVNLETNKTGNTERLIF